VTGQAWSSACYLIWPAAARKLLSSLPANVPLATFISRHLHLHLLRALVCWPQPAMELSWGEALAARSQRQYVARYRVVHAPRIATREKPRSEAAIVRAVAEGTELEAVAHSADGNWAQLGAKEWAMIRHDTLGVLLERLAEEPESDDDDDGL